MDNKTNLINAQQELIEHTIVMLKEAKKTVNFSDKAIGRFIDLCQKVNKLESVVFNSDETVDFLVNKWSNLVFNTKENNDK